MMLNYFIVFAENFIDNFHVNSHEESGVSQQFVGTDWKFDYSSPAESLVSTIAVIIGKVLIPLVILGALVIITVSGVRYIVSSGNETQTENAKKTLNQISVFFIFIIFLSSEPAIFGY